MMRPIAMTLICSQLCACSIGPSWHAHEVTPQLAARDSNAEQVRLTLHNDSVLVASYPKLIDDSLVWVGRPDGKRLSAGDSTVRFAVALDQIVMIERWGQTAQEKQGTAAVTVLAVGAFVALVAALGSWAKDIRSISFGN